MNRTKHSFLVVERGDTFSQLVAKVFHLSGPAVTAKTKSILKLNPHIQNPDRIRPGQVIYFGSDSGFDSCPPSPWELRSMEGCFSVNRTFLVENWEIISAFMNTGADSFVNQTGMNPMQLKSALGNPRNVEATSSAFAVVAPVAYEFAKTAGQTGALGLDGKFGNFAKTSPFVWSQLEGQLVRSLKSQARYLKQMNGALRMIPGNARAFGLNGKIITVVPQAAGLQSFSQTVAKGEMIAKHLRNLGTVTKVVDFGLSVKTVHDKWNTKERNRTVTVEATKFGAGAAWAAGSEVVAGAICGALTLTTGPGGIACYSGVFLVGGIAASNRGGALGNYIQNKLEESGVERFFNQKIETVDGVPWLYKGAPVDVGI